VGASSGSCAAAPDLRPYEGPVLGRRACGNARSHRSTSAPSHHHDASRHIEARHSPRQALAKNASMGSSFISNYSPSARDLPPRGRRTGRHFRLAPVHLHSLEAARCGGARLLFRTARLVGRGMQEPGTTAEWSLRASPRSARRSSPMKVDRDCEPWSISQPLTPAGDRTLKD
jgi:hypothetical protein